MSKHPRNEEEEIEAFQEYFEEAERTDYYWAEKAKIQFTEEILKRMSELDLSKKHLAERLKVNPAQISRLCSGNNNFGIATMSRIARGLQCELQTHLQPEGTKTHWLDVLSNNWNVEFSTDTDYPVTEEILAESQTEKYTYECPAA